MSRKTHATLGAFDKVIRSVKRNFGVLMASSRHRVAELPREMPKAGIYLFSENGRALYVGRSNNLRRRLQFHTRNNHNQATLAFLIARRKTGFLKASYQSKGSRQDLLRDARFRAEFDTARERIRQIDVQFVEVNDPIEQTLLEVFAALQTGARYNDFDNH